MIVGPQSISDSHPTYVVYGADKLNLPVINPSVDGCRVVLLPYGAPTSFDKSAGAVVFQRAFENRSGRQYTYDRDGLLRRLNEIRLLIAKDGFVCFLLHTPMLTESELHPIDLPNMCLMDHEVEVFDLPTSTSAIAIKRPEFEEFLSRFGAAWSVFHRWPENKDVRTIATCTFDNEEIASALVIDSKVYVLPCLMPRGDPALLSEFFRALIPALTKSDRRISEDLPDWASSFAFKCEGPLQSKREEHLVAVAQINAELDRLKDFKWALAATGDRLVDAVAKILAEGFGFNVERKEEYREDLRVLDENGKPAAFVEVKGVSRGVTRENVNQVDSHRDRAELPATFPALLIQNTQNNAKSLRGKEQPVAGEQIRHAVNLNVLIVLTTDMLRLLDLHLANRNAGIAEAWHHALLTRKGWLRVEGTKVMLENGDEEASPICILEV
jgi:hypothetical protein